VRPGGRRRVLVAGAGEVVASGYLPALARLGWSATILDLDMQRARSVARLYGRASASKRRLSEIDAARYEAVVVATPLPTHLEVVRTALAAGARTVLVEKPPFRTGNDLRIALRAANAARARLFASFYTRAWPSVQRARASFPDWRERLGPLVRVLVAQGRPWSWASVAARERGAAGLESLLLEELPHPLDTVFHISGWRHAVVREGPQPPSETPWAFSGSVLVGADGGEPVLLELLGSRRHTLANAVTFEFDRGVATAELSPTGGVIVREGGSCELELTGVRTGADMRELFTGVLRGVAGDGGAGAPPAVEAAEWAGPVAVVDVLRDRPAGERDAPETSA